MADICAINTASPADTDAESTLGQQLRDLKTDLQGFALMEHNCDGTHKRSDTDDTGAANAYAATVAHKFTALYEGFEILFVAANTNTGASTFALTTNTTAIGAVAIKKGGVALIAGDIVAGRVTHLIYTSGAVWELVNSPIALSLEGGSPVIQSVSGVTAAAATGTTIIPQDDTIPQQITEGTEIVTCAITPKSATNKLRIAVVLHASVSTDSRHLVLALFQDSTAGALAAASQWMPSNDKMGCISFVHVMTAGTTSATTFKLRAGPATATTMTVNGSGGARLFGGVLISGIYIQEIKQ